MSEKDERGKAEQSNVGLASSREAKTLYDKRESDYFRSLGFECSARIQKDWISQLPQWEAQRELNFPEEEERCLTEEVQSLLQKRAIADIDLLCMEMNQGFVS